MDLQKSENSDELHAENGDTTVTEYQDQVSSRQRVAYDLTASITGSIHSLPVDVADDTKCPREGAPEGRWGWVVVFVSFSMMFTVGLGFVTFGIIYVDLVEHFGGQAGPIGWVGSIFMFGSQIFCVPASVFIDLYGCRIVAFSGGLLAGLGFFLSAFATNGLLLLASYGIIAGVGSGMVYITCLVAVQQYFDKNRTKATAFSSAGISVGSIASAPLVQILTDTYGWRGALMIEAGIILQATVLALLFRPVSQYSKIKHVSSTSESNKSFFTKIKEKVFDLSILKNVRFLLICASGLFTPLTISAALLHTPQRAYYYGVERRVASMLPIAIGSCAFLSRLIFGVIGDLKCSNRIMIFSVCCTLINIVMMTYSKAVTLPWIVVSCVAFGLLFGCYTTLQPTSLVDLVGVAKFPRAQAMFMVCFGIPSLIATPLVGYILDHTQDYSLGFLITGGIGMIGGILALAASFLDLHKKRSKVNKGQNSS